MGNQISQRKLDNALMQAIEKGTEEQVKLLLKSGANPNDSPEEYNFLSRTALHQAALCKCSTKKLKILLQFVRDIGELASLLESNLICNTLSQLLKLSIS